MHIGIIFLNIIGTWLDGSGWSDIYEKSRVNTSWRVTSFLKRIHVKRSRYAQQITPPALVNIAHQAYLETDYSCYDDWKKLVMES